jgi:hypothetical protein
VNRWRWRGSIALLGVSLAFFILPLVPAYDVINSDWPAFATGARLIVSDPGHLYDLDTQKRVQHEVTGGRVLVTLGIEGILPFLAPAWVALLAVPFEALGTEIGGRAWVLFGLICLGCGLYLATRPRPPTAILPGFAAVPTALMLLNAQLDGIVALGVGAAVWLWTRPYVAGLSLGLTLVKPQLVLPIAAALLVARQWKVLAGWAAAGMILVAITVLLNPTWIFDWLRQTRATVTSGSREVDLAHFATHLPGWIQAYGVVFLVLLAVAYAVALAARRRRDFKAAAAILVMAGVVASPHALPADLVLVALGLAIWGEATWREWLGLSAAALIAALTPAPVPAAIGVLLVFGWLTLRISLGRSSVPEPALPG